VKIICGNGRRGRGEVGNARKGKLNLRHSVKKIIFLKSTSAKSLPLLKVKTPAVPD